MARTSTEPPGGAWYEEGVRFHCTRCGRCCRGAPGVVRVSDPEIEALARRFEMSRNEFRQAYVRRLRGGDESLRERANGDCVLYREGVGCTAYGDRPRQCRTYPFWRPILHSADTWREEATGCPGIGGGPIWDREAIERALREEES